MKYTEKVMGIVKDSLALIEQVKTEREDLKFRHENGEFTDKWFAVKNRELDSKEEELRLEASRLLQEAGKAYCAMVEKTTEIDGAMLHDDAKLLQMDLKMTPHQFEVLVEKHRENPLMSQLLREYSNKHEGLYASFAPTAADKIGAFNDFVGKAMDTVRTPDTMTAALFQDGKCIPQICLEGE